MQFFKIWTVFLLLFQELIELGKKMHSSFEEVLARYEPTVLLSPAFES